MYIVAGIPCLALATGVAAQLVWDTSAALTRRYLPGARIAPPVLLAMVYVIAFAFLPIRQGFEQLRTIFTVDENGQPIEAGMLRTARKLMDGEVFA